MSLTSFLKIKDVKETFKKEFEKPQFKAPKKLLAPPLTKNYTLVGTAFDYLLRFYIKRLNPNAIEYCWIAERVYEMYKPKENYTVIPSEWAENPDVYEKFLKIIPEAKKAYNAFIKTGEITSELCKATLLLAQLDSIFRSFYIPKNFEINKKDVEDLKKLISIVKPEYFKAKKICILNPTFGAASELVHGADCDLVIDDMIVDIKTTKETKFRRDYFNQLVGYYILYQIGGIEGLPPNYKIKKLGVYFSRYAYFYVINVDNIIKKETFPAFIKWFKKRASEVFHKC